LPHGRNVRTAKNEIRTPDPRPFAGLAEAPAGDGRHAAVKKRRPASAGTRDQIRRDILSEKDLPVRSAHANGYNSVPRRLTSATEK
jgi:hypothetical protein